jgi:hypothetical protein
MEEKPAYCSFIPAPASSFYQVRNIPRKRKKKKKFEAWKKGGGRREW